MSVTVDTSGKFAYAANYASNTVSVYSIDRAAGALTAGASVAAGLYPGSVTTMGAMQQSSGTADFPEGARRYHALIRQVVYLAMTFLKFIFTDTGKLEGFDYRCKSVNERQIILIVLHARHPIMKNIHRFQS